MSYEGSTEFLCRKGHYHCQDCYEDDPAVCAHCGSGFEWRHSIDSTNGYEEENPYTYPADKEEVGFDDLWRLDHHGNRYAIKLPRFRPHSDEWRRVAPEPPAKEPQSPGMVYQPE